MPPTPTALSPIIPSATIADDILYGADGIAEFLYGDAKLRRKVYNLVETGRIPHFKLGAGLCARKSVLLAWIAKQESLPHGGWSVRCAFSFFPTITYGLPATRGSASNTATAASPRWTAFAPVLLSGSRDSFSIRSTWCH
jgi:hypothetical protein